MEVDIQRNTVKHSVHADRESPTRSGQKTKPKTMRKSKNV